LNDQAYYKEKIKETGKDDTRFLVRGKVDWEQLEKDLKDKGSFSSQVFEKIKKMVRIRKKYKTFGRGSIYWLDGLKEDGSQNEHILAYIRKYRSRRIMIVQNLSNQTQTFKLSILSEISWIDLFGNQAEYNDINQTLTMKPFEYLWIRL